MLSIKHIRIGQILYLNSPFGIEKVQLLAIDNESNKGYLKVKHIGTVDEKGKVISRTYGEGYAKEADLFLDVESTITFVKAKEEERYNNYLKEIKTLKDLITFPLYNDFSDFDGCRDELIVKAYITRAEELLGISVVKE